MSEHPHGATTIHASKGGGGGAKWLLGGLAALVLAGGGYYAWQNYGPSQTTTEIAAADDPYAAEPLPAASFASSPSAPAEDVARDEIVATPASTDARPARRSTARAAVVPEETIGITPINATVEESATDSDEIVVTAPRRPVWASTPSARRLSALYPERALARGREGEARLHCIVQAGGALDCERVSETSASFGSAALRVSRTLRHAAVLPDGSDAVGSPVNLRVVFRMADEDTRRG